MVMAASPTWTKTEEELKDEGEGNKKLNPPFSTPAPLHGEKKTEVPCRPKEIGANKTHGVDKDGRAAEAPPWTRMEMDRGPAGMRNHKTLTTPFAHLQVPLQRVKASGAQGSPGEGPDYITRCGGCYEKGNGATPPQEGGTAAVQPDQERQNDSRHGEIQCPHARADSGAKMGATTRARDILPDSSQASAYGDRRLPPQANFFDIDAPTPLCDT
jgi:hypothetical protein